MDKEKYRKYIGEMVERIEDEQDLKRIFDYVHSKFIKPIKNCKIVCERVDNV